MEHHAAQHGEHEGHPDHSSHAGHAMPQPGTQPGHEAHAGQMADHSGHAGHIEHAAPPAQDEHAGHDEHEGHEYHISHEGHEKLFRNRFWVSLILTLPVLAYTELLQDWFGFTPPAFPGSQWLVPVLSAAIFGIGGLPFLSMAVPELRNRKPGMMTLISLAISVAFIYSAATLFLVPGMGFFWEMVTLIDVMLLGHWLEMRSIRQASSALNELAKLMPDTAEHIMPDGSIHTMPVSQLQVGDLVLVRPGVSVPADGEVVEGKSSVSEAMITGESRPVDKVAGERVIAGTINGEGSLRVRVAATGDQTALAGIMRLVREAQMSKTATQVLADKAAGWLFYVALGAAAITAVAWVIAVGFDVVVIERVVTVLVIACPHALGLAIPLVVAISTSLGARNGLLIRDRIQMELARELDAVIFDKTGTLTRGEQGVVGLALADGWDESLALAMAAAVEGDSEHLIAQAIRKAADERGLTLPAIGGFEAIKGRGVKATAGGRTVHVGGPRLLELLKASLPAAIQTFTEEAGRKGQTVVHLVVDGKPAAAFALADVIRPESRQAVKRLKELGIEVAMLTGDSQAVADAVAAELGIGTVFAEVLPEHKDQKVAELQKQGKRVAMVGDGINDAPALTRADVGIAIGSGTDVAVESAGLILVQSNPMDVVKMIELSRASYRKMIENLVWATGYNVVAIPLAAGALAPVGIILSPAVGALLMSLSTVIVAINAQFLRRTPLGVAG